MKVGSKELFAVMRQVVREEVRKVLPEMVRQHLTETYIRQMVLEAAARPARSGKPGLSELLQPVPDVDEDHVPEPMLNTDRGIYNADSLTKPENRKDTAVHENMRYVRKQLGPLAFVLEGAKIPGEAKDDPGISEEKIAALSPDFEKMSRLVESANETAASKKEMSTPEMKMRELEMRRKALDVPVRRGG